MRLVPYSSYHYVKYIRILLDFFEESLVNGTIKKILSVTDRPFARRYLINLDDLCRHKNKNSY